MPRRRSSACPGLDGVPCGQPKVYHSGYCAGHHAEYQRRWRGEMRVERDRLRAEVVRLRQLVREPGPLTCPHCGSPL